MMKNKLIVILSLLIIVSLFFSPAQSEESTWVPSGYKHWSNSISSRKQKVLLGAPIQHYKSSDSTWKEINNSWVNLSDTLYVVKNSVLKTDVYPNGKSQVLLTLGNQEIKVLQQLNCIILFNHTTGKWKKIDSTIEYTNRTIDNNIIYWSNYFKKIDYALIKENGRLQHRIYFTPTFLDSLVLLYDSLPVENQYSLANVVEYTLDNTDSLTNSFDMNQRIFKKIGRESFKLSSQQLFYKGWDSLQTIYVKQKWVKKDSIIYCIEYVPMQYIKTIHQQNPTDTIWHNDSQEFDYTDCEDTYVRSDYADRNLGLNISIYPIVSSSSEYGGFLKFDLTVIPSQAIIDSTWISYQFTNYNMTHNLCRMLTDWDEGTEVSDEIDNTGEHGATYNYSKDDFSGTNTDWENTTNFSSSDYDDNSGSYYGQVASTASLLKDTLFVGSPSSGNMSYLIQNWVNGSYQNYGFGLKGTSTSAQIRSSEIAIPDIRPMLYVEWTIPPEQDSNRRRLLNNIRRK